ncbi:hypothetical protein [Marmoricola sp. RAF53]|uniref:hypothetical protein n=1 Tax=Marmoricola sp. RAF53 TaxID=3233059 RepID=UPI003F99233D
MIGNVETAFDGVRWYNRIVGSSVAANYRDTALEAELKGREMARARRVDHIVLDEDGGVVSHTRY